MISKFRLFCFLTHLSISIAIALVSMFIVFFVWYPSPLANIVGVTSIFYMMLGIDVTLGPLLTLILAKKGKKGLSLDLTIIAILQISALFYGMYNIAVARPAWIVFDTFRFDVVQADEIDKSKIDKALPEFRTVSWFGPQYAAVEPVKNEKDKSDRLFYEFNNGYAPTMRLDLLRPIDDVAWANIKEKQSADEYIKSKEITGSLFLKAFNENGLVLVNTNDKKIIDIIKEVKND